MRRFSWALSLPLPGHQGPDCYRGLEAEACSLRFAGPAVTEEQETESQDDMLPRLDSEASRPELWKPLSLTPAGKGWKSTVSVAIWSRYKTIGTDSCLTVLPVCVFYREKESAKSCVWVLLLLLLSLKAFNHQLVGWQEIALPYFGLELKRLPNPPWCHCLLTPGKQSISTIQGINLNLRLNLNLRQSVCSK